MRAVTYDSYGSTDKLRIENIPVPTPSADQVLVKVVATSVNLSDWESLTGSPLYARLGGLRRPGRRTLGSDIAGRVESVGTSVTGFEPGDEVYADNLWLKGGFAEYAIVPAVELAKKPEELTFVQASAIPQSGAISFQGTAGASDGQRVLVNGAGGGTGALALQLLRLTGAHTTGVDSADKLDFMSSLGADQVIDYRTVDFTRDRASYDLILDLVAHRSALAYRRALAPGGRYRCVGGSMSTLLQLLTVGFVAGRLTGRRVGVLGVKQGREHFGPVADRCAAGDIEVQIDRVFTLEQVPEALAHVGRGRSLGKAVVQVEDC